MQVETPEVSELVHDELADAYDTYIEWGGYLSRVDYGSIQTVLNGEGDLEPVVKYPFY